MDSTRPNRSYLFAPLYPNSLDKAAFSLKKGLVFIEQYSRAGMIAGVFFGTDRAFLRRRNAKLAEALHIEGMQQFSWCRIH